MRMQLQVAPTGSANIVATVRQYAPALLALTSPVAAEICELNAAGVPYTTVAELYPFDVIGHLPLIFERLSAAPTVTDRLTASPIRSALAIFGFGALTEEFRHVELAVFHYANQHLPERALDREAAAWWAYLLACIVEQDRWPRFGSPGRAQEQLKAATADALSVIDVLLASQIAEHRA